MQVIQSIKRLGL